MGGKPCIRNLIYISFILKTNTSNLDTAESLEKLYNSVYKPFIKLVNHYPELKFSLILNGTFISYLKRKRKEYITLLRQLVDSRQIEIIGSGGYYDPILPLLLTVDRNGQIDMLNSEIRQTIGVRPRGINLFCDCWDSSLVNTLQVCGLEYVILNNSLIPEEKCQFLPIIMNNLGKSIEIFPVYNELCPSSDLDAETFINNLAKHVKKSNKKSDFIQFEPDKIINIEFTPEKLGELIENKWFEKFVEYLRANPECGFEPTTTQAYRKLNTIKIPCHIPCGINTNVSRFTGEKINSIYDYMDVYPLSKKLYNRLSYVGMLINQFKKDKMRKFSARDKLWLAQSGSALIFSENGNCLPTKHRQKSYKYLMEAEKIIRETETFKESVSSFDYNGDGLNEYVCRMKNYFSYITLIGGSIQELDILKSSGNYADNLQRLEQFDGCNDNYERGLFIDHIFDETQISSYLDGKPAGDGIFSKVIYNEIKFSAGHKEILLSANASIPRTKQRIYLRKKYIINSDGMNIQYIVKNESDKPLKFYFAIESNIANTNFDKDVFSYYKQDLLSSENIFEIDSSKNTNLQDIKLNNVDMVRIIDQDNGVILGFEPNENCNYCSYPLTFLRPDANNTLNPVHLTFVSTLYWQLNLEPGRETEKTINFSITNVKKIKK